jgi:hypothetical protein
MLVALQCVALACAAKYCRLSPLEGIHNAVMRLSFFFLFGMQLILKS